MKKQILAVLAAGCLFLGGCGERQSPEKTLPQPTPPARTLLVVPVAQSCAQAFLLFRVANDGDLALSVYPRETVFPLKTTEQEPLFSLFGEGGAMGFSETLAAFRENSIPVDRILSVDVSDADSGFYTLLSQAGNNLLFTNPPSFVYTVCNVRASETAVAISAADLRHILAISAENFDRPADYALLRQIVARAVVATVAAAFSDEADAAFAALSSIGNSSLTPADRSAFSALFSPSPRVRLRPLSGEFVGRRTRLRFYPQIP